MQVVSTRYPSILGVFWAALLAISIDLPLLADEKPDPPAVRFDPVAKNIAGWTVHVEPSLLNDTDDGLGSKSLRMLADHLNKLAILISKSRLKELRTLEIWLEQEHPKLKSMQYHPNVGWLRKHGHDPRLAKKVHIPVAKALIERSQLVKHPFVVLHELAHAYHDQILSFDHPEILRAYKAAKARGDYEKVLLYTGKQVRHYGMTNHKEYFAEGTESYLGRNDFYPFVRAELAEHDPEFHKILKTIWGPVH